MITIRPADRRGHADHGWLQAYHTFSFARFHDPEWMGFSALRVLNQDTIQGGQGFGTHPHDNMEILTWVLSGALEHKDSMGNGGVIRPGEAQFMSAGTGITHSEFNHSPDEPCHLLQMWVLPSARGTEPRYDQRRYDHADLAGGFCLVASGNEADDAIHIGQDARFLAGRFAASESATLELGAGRTAWLHVPRGRVTLNDQDLGPGDGAAVTETAQLVVTGVEDAEVVIWDLPGA